MTGMLALLLLASPLEEKIDRILDNPEVQQAHWGIHVVDGQTGRVLYARNAMRLFQPASNLKLFTTALALEVLGADHRYTTTIRASGAIDANGVLRGDLRLVGDGDPTLSGRVYPYQKDAPRGNPVAALDELVTQLAAKGLKRITGDVVGDDRKYAWEPSPDGWTQDDAIWEYGAPVSALTLNDNSYSLVIQPGSAAGLPARLSLAPWPVDLVVDNRLQTVAGRNQAKVRIDRFPGARQLRVSGTIGVRDNATRELLAVDDPALFAAGALYEALTRQGIAVDGVPVAEHRSAGVTMGEEGGAELARRVGPPLGEVLQVVNKVSQNLHTELLLREVAHHRHHAATREGALEELRGYLGLLGAGGDQAHVEDASGLSRRDLVMPATLTAVLARMNAFRERELWVSFLPTGGADGSLAKRYEKIQGARAIHAKTGSLANVTSLSGYADCACGRRIFSIVVNHYAIPSSAIRATIDKIAIALLE